MHISRKMVAKLLETKPSNIKSLRQIEEKIYIKLRNSQDEFSMTIQDYRNCSQQLRCDREQIDYLKFVSIALVIGTFILLTQSSLKIALTDQSEAKTNTRLVINYYIPILSRLLSGLRVTLDANGT